MAASVSAADWYVRAGASGRGTGPDSPYDEVWKALEKAVRGDVIHVAEGVYHGKGGSGHFIVKVPELKLVGGYSPDFKERDPFKRHTVLERARDFKGDWVGLPEAIVAGEADHSGFVLDGFVLNAESRNSYKDDVISLRAPTYLGMLIQLSSPNVKIRNNILLNPAGDGIYCVWQGQDNVIENNFILNTFYAAIETRSAQPDSRILIKSNTIAFGWFYPSKGGAIGILVGRQGATIIDSNVIAFMQTEGGEAGFGVTNTFGNPDTVMRGNVFFALSGGYYKYMDVNGQSLVVWKPSELEDLNDPDFCYDYMLAESGGNRDADPGFLPDKGFAGKFSASVASEPGKLDMGALNEWRRMMGLPLEAAPGSARKNFGFPYPLAAVAPGMVSKLAGVGARIDAPLLSYRSEPAAAEKPSYEKVEFSSFKKGQPNARGNEGRPVEFLAGLGDAKMTFELEQAPRADYLCYQVIKPGSTSASTIEAIYVYILKGSPAQKQWDALYRNKADTYKAGVTIRGRAFDFKNQSYSYPVGIILDEVRR